MFEVTEYPALVSLQGMPFVFKVFSDSVEPFLKIMAEPVSGQFELLPVDPITNLAIFDLREYFKTELVNDLNIGSAVVHANACKSFTVNFLSYYGNPPQAHYITGIPLMMMPGKIPRWKQLEFNGAGYESFEGYLVVGNKTHLTWYPDQPKRVLPDQPEVMYFIARAAATYAITVTINYSDDTSDIYDPGVSVDALLYQICSIPVGYNKLGIGAVDPEKTVVSYTVAFAGNTFPRTYLVDHNAYRDTRYIIFRNTLSGYDVLACTGEADESTDTERKIAERVYDVENPNRLNKRVYYSQQTEIVKLNSGWLQANEKDWLNDMMESEEVYEIKGDGLRQPILIRSTSLDRSVRNYEPGSVEIEYERLYNTV